MTLYTLIEAVIGLVAGVLLAACSKRADGVVYGKLDKAGRVTNIVLIPIYALLAPFCMFFGMISEPHYEGFLAVLGWIVSIIIASAPLFSGLGLGFSVMLRKQGKSRQSFTVQFLGLLGAVLSVGLYCIFAGNLLRPLN